MKTVILDTDFLVFCAENKVDYPGEIKRLSDFQYVLAIVEPTLAELERVESKRQAAVKLARMILKKHAVRVLPSKCRFADEAILEIDLKEVCVASQDQELKRQLRARGVPVFTVRQKSHLVLERNPIA